MQQIFRRLEKFFPLLKNTFLPAAIFTVGLLGFYLWQPQEKQLAEFHYTLLLLCLLSFGALFYFNRGKPAFFIITTFVAYIILNFLKKKYGEECILSPEFVNLSILLPATLVLLYYLPARSFQCRENLLLFAVLLAEYTLGEKLSEQGVSIGFSLGFETYAALNNLSLLFFAAALLSFFITASVSGSILDTALFFATAETGLGFYYAPAPGAPIIFFGCAALTIFVAVNINLYNSIYRDSLTGLYSRSAFLSQAKNFPLKYSLSLILIDDYKRLTQIFGKKSMKKLLRMITERILSVENDASIYSYSSEEYIIVFKGEDKNAAFEKTEAVRRSIASAEFILHDCKKPIKLTISCSVSEKKRSDANVLDVLSRAEKAMQKTGRFTQNITTKA